MAKKKKRVHEGLAIISLLLNVLILPGLGSIVGGRISTGVIQMVLTLLGGIITLTLIGAFIGIPLIVAMWIWGLVTGIQVIKEAQ